LKNQQTYAKTTFNKVAENYDKIPFFKISANYVVEFIKEYKSEGNLSVLDVACGTGNVVLVCASCMEGSCFDAVDISQGMLDKAKANASAKKLENINFFLSDVTALNLDKKYDVITCSYALFFLPDSPKVLASLRSLLKTDGIIIFTSFLAQAFEPSSEILLNLLAKYGSSSAKEYDKSKWENLKNIKDIKKLCDLATVNHVNIQSKEIRYDMDVDEWWELFNNTGYKGMLMELSTEDYESVKSEYYEAMFAYADMDGKIELNTDTYFVIVS
jgi:ubiquinone/menaquinone biosynthesis C-methylase UbiE